MSSLRLPKLNNEHKTISSLIKRNNINYLINLSNSFELESESIVKIINCIKKNNNNFIQKIKILIISNLSYQVFDKIIKKKLILKKINSDIDYIDYNKFLSENFINENQFDYIIFLPDVSDFEDISSYAGDIFSNSKNVIEITKFYSFILKKINTFSSKVFISNLINFQKIEFGTYTRKNKNLRFNLIQKINNFILIEINKYNFYLLDLELIAFKFGIDKLRDYSKFYFGRVPFSLEFSENLYSIISNLINVSLGKIKKILVLDLDNTIWGGILGDDGPEGVTIGNDTPIGKAFVDFQKTILNLKRRGVLLAICSKNDLENVKKIFQVNKNLILNLDDFVSVKVNWENKAKNIKEISQEINIGLESFVFFDDNPVERNLVRSLLPEVAIPELDEDPSSYTSILLNSFFFDIISYSKEDLKRSKTYLLNAKREKLKNDYDNINDYLKSLNMNCTACGFKQENYDRIVQLFQRSNQFNFTTIRYSLNEIKKIANNKSKVTFQFSFKDKFSDYGIISLVVCSLDNKNLNIDNWVMSCRVLNRTLENFIINNIFEYCKKNNIKNVSSLYIENEKNKLVKDLYKNLGFEIKNQKEKKIIFSYDTKKFKLKTTFVKRKN